MREKELKRQCIKYVQNLKGIWLFSSPLDNVRNLAGISVARYKTQEEKDNLIYRAFNMFYAEGWQKGTPDICIISSIGRSVFLELKRTKSKIITKGELIVKNHEGNELEGPREDKSCLVFEFHHEVYLPYDKEENKIQGSRRISAFTIVKDIDKL